MKQRKIILLIGFLLIGFSIFSQNWKQLNKIERDSLKTNRFIKKKYFVGFEPGFGIMGQGSNILGIGFKIEPQFGYFIKDNMLPYISTTYSNSNVEYDSLIEKQQNYLVGLHFRYYLPEHNMKIRFFVQAGIFGGFIHRLKTIEHIAEENEIWMLACIFKAGVSVPIRRHFNIEVGMWHNYQLVNYEVIDTTDWNYFFNFSYTF